MIWTFRPLKGTGVRIVCSGCGRPPESFISIERNPSGYGCRFFLRFLRAFLLHIPEFCRAHIAKLQPCGICRLLLRGSFFRCRNSKFFKRQTPAYALFIYIQNSGSCQQRNDKQKKHQQTPAKDTGKLRRIIDSAGGINGGSFICAASSFLPPLQQSGKIQPHGVCSIGSPRRILCREHKGKNTVPFCNIEFLGKSRDTRIQLIILNHNAIKCIIFRKHSLGNGDCGVVAHFKQNRCRQGPVIIELGIAQCYDKLQIDLIGLHIGFDLIAVFAFRSIRLALEIFRLDPEGDPAGCAGGYSSGYGIGNGSALPGRKVKGLLQLRADFIVQTNIRHGMGAGICHSQSKKRSAFCSRILLHGQGELHLYIGYGSGAFAGSQLFFSFDGILHNRIDHCIHFPHGKSVRHFHRCTGQQLLLR